MTAMAVYACPGCGKQAQSLPGAEPMHRCPKRNKRWVSFKAVVVKK